MPFSIRLYRRFPVQCAVTYSAGLISRLRTQRASLFKGITTVVSLGTLAVLVTGCSSAQLDDAGLQSRNRISDQFLNSYDQCLKTYKSEPAKSTYNCYALYGTAAYYRQDYDLALKTLAPLAEQSEPKAQHILGFMYANGYGVPKNIETAVRWQILSAEQGHVGAMATLADYYEKGEGVPQDYKQAMKWKQLAANFGNDLTRWSLGLAYKDGKMTPKDNVQAYMWFSLAIADSEPPLRQFFEEARDSLAKEMTLSQIADAQRLTSEWKPKSK